MSYKLGFNNIRKFGQHINNAAETLEYTMSNLLDGFFDNNFNKATEGKFKAICLSGVENFDNSTLQEDGYMKIIVRPLTKFGEICPDPREYEDADGINKSIALHAGVFTAKSDFQFKDHSPIKFGQIITCYYEKGSITNSIFRGLRFEEPTGVEIAKSFQDLAAIDGVSAGSLFEAPGQLPGLMGDLIGLVQGALESFSSGDGGGPGGPFDPGAGAAYEGGNNVTEPSKNGVSPDECTKRGLLFPTHGPRKRKPTNIIIHCTAGTSNWEGTLGRQNKKLTGKGSRLGYHFLISRTGKFVQCAHPDLKTWHAGGNSSKKWYGVHLGGSENSVGVSCCNFAGEPGRKGYGDKEGKVPPKDTLVKADGHIGYVFAHPLKFNEKTKLMEVSSRKKWTEKYPQAQMDACVDICAVLCLQYGISPDQIRQHQAVVAKGDPGGTFHVDEALQGIEYDPNLTLFKAKVRSRMAALKGKQLLDQKNRIVAGYGATTEGNQTTPEQTEELKKKQENETGPDGPTSHDGKKIEK